MSMDAFLRQAREWGVWVSGEQQKSLLAYARELAGYEKANVIGVRDIDEVLLGHVLDSLSCLIFTPLGRARSLVDVGSGGGLPGLPLKILRPRMEATLVEATGKKAEFLRAVVEKLDLRDVQVVNDRAENVGRMVGHRGRYEVATVRAVAALDVIFEYCAPLLEKGGYVVSMKGRLDGGEITAGENAARLLGIEVSEIIEVPFLPEMPDKRRNLVIARKIADTPERYPRKNGQPRKKPLGTDVRK